MRSQSSFDNLLLYLIDTFHQFKDLVEGVGFEPT